MHYLREGLGGISPGRWRVIQLDPLPEQVLRLLLESGRVVELPCLGDALVDVRCGAARTAVGGAERGLVSGGAGAAAAHHLQETGDVLRTAEEREGRLVVYNHKKKKRNRQKWAI